MDILKEVIDAWGWVGIEPTEVIEENDFGNLILKDIKGKLWRLCPEDVYCKVIANDIEKYNELVKDDEFNEDWFMVSIVEEAQNRLGPLKDGYKYYLVIPGILGGEYGGANIQSVPFYEVIRYSGDIGRQAQGLPEGAKVNLKVINKNA